MLAWSLLFQHTPGQSRLPSPCFATIVNSLLFYTIDLLPSSPNIQVFVEVFSCSTRGLSALLPDVDPKHPANCQLSYCTWSHCAICLHVVHISPDYFTCMLFVWFVGFVNFTADLENSQTEMHWCDDVCEFNTWMITLRYWTHEIWLCWSYMRLIIYLQCLYCTS